MIRRNKTSGHFRSAGVNHLYKPKIETTPLPEPEPPIPIRTNVFKEPDQQKRKKFQR